jgi:hypothetical protein
MVNFQPQNIVVFMHSGASTSSGKTGLYTLRIRDLDNRGIDEVEFEVR